MKWSIRIAIALAVIGGIAAAAYQPVIAYWKERHRSHWRTAEVTCGRIIDYRTATGTVKPVLSVSIGSFVSGPIKYLYADFNQEVETDQVLARVDPRLYEANVARDEANLATRNAEVERVQALLQQAERNEQRAVALRNENPDFISVKEMDAIHFERMSLVAQLKLAEASIEQAQAALENSQANYEYTYIRSPVDGIVIDRKIDRGQTLAAQFQTPELFIVAPDMEKEMHIFASVNEADIGLIKEAKTKGFPVEFKVDAYPDDVFYGEIEQVRMNSTTTENVVTYPVVVSAPNPDLKLLPGMTASISFQVDERDDVTRVPSSAVRFYPDTPELVRPEDREILTGQDDEEDDLTEPHLTAAQREELRQRRNRRHVWRDDGEFLKAVEIKTGLFNLKHYELVSGELSEGDALVIGEKTDEGGA